jgi:hypothetical protein
MEQGLRLKIAMQCFFSLMEKVEKGAGGSARANLGPLWPHRALQF